MPGAVVEVGRGSTQRPVDRAVDVRTRPIAQHVLELGQRGLARRTTHALEMEIDVRGFLGGKSALQVREEDVLDAFKQVVGRSRREVSLYLMQRFDLEPAARAQMQEFGVETAWQAFAQRRLQIYEQMVSAPDLLREHRWPHTLALLERVHNWPVRVGLATMSHCEQTRRVLEALDLTGFTEDLRRSQRTNTGQAEERGRALTD